MIEINGKKLEVGDTVVFRCGGEAVVEGLGDVDLDVYCNFVKFVGHESYNYSNNGAFKIYDAFLDIVDIKKAPKKKIVIYDRELWFENSYDEEVSFRCHIEYDLTNKKTLSVEMVE